jgi:hypothetical protein
MLKVLRPCGYAGRPHVIDAPVNDHIRLIQRLQRGLAPTPPSPQTYRQQCDGRGGR